jgi:hypothetical protein
MHWSEVSWCSIYFFQDGLKTEGYEGKELLGEIRLPKIISLYK